MANNSNNNIPRVSMPKNVDMEYANVSKLAHYISTTSGIVDSGEAFELITMPSKNASISVALNSDEGIVLSKNITQFDATIMDAVYSLFINGCRIFSPEMVARMISGDPKRNVSAQKIGAVTRSINKLRHIDITIDMTDEYKKTGKTIEEDIQLKRKSYLLPLEEYSAVKSDNGKVTTNKTVSYTDSENENVEIEVIAGYSFIKKPVLYTYAEQNGEIENFPIKLLDIPNVSDTDENSSIKWYLIRRIGALKKAKNKNSMKDIIYYDQEQRQGAFSDLWYDQSEYSNWKKKKSKIHKTITTILDSFISEKYISSYNVLYEGKTVIGVEINVESKY